MRSTLHAVPGHPRAAGAWCSFGEWLLAVKRAGDGEGIDPRLVRAPSGANEVDPTAGGFAAPDQYSQEIITSLYAGATITPLCDTTGMTGSMAGIKLPAIDETSRQDGSRFGGTQAYWLGEGTTVTSSRPRFKNLEFAGKKLIALVYLTSELFRDAALLEAHVREALTSELSFNLDLSILSGTGAGTPLGILNSAALITVAKQAGQVGTIVGANITDMWQRMDFPSRKNAVWLVNEDAPTQLDALAGGPNGNPLIYVPAGINGNPYALLEGRPVVPIEQANPLGQIGDIVLADLTQYKILQGPLQSVISAEVQFLTDELAWRFALRVDGKPKWTSPITPRNGSAITRSPFVALAAR